VCDLTRTKKSDRRQFSLTGDNLVYRTKSKLRELTQKLKHGNKPNHRLKKHLQYTTEII